ncbi:MAG: zinc carboxypeptidase [Deltaproteobacteria bacterium]|nr:zinc carboxypeptidase [Deltaproteobacteria bacterium]
MPLLKRVMCIAVFLPVLAIAGQKSDQLSFVKAWASGSAERTAIANAGIAIDSVLSDSVTFVARSADLRRLSEKGIAFESTPLPERNDFPSQDSAYHNYAEIGAELDALAHQYPALVKRVTIGKSFEGRDVVGVRVSSSSLEDSLPSALFIGCHHAREHLSVEVPLKLADHLAAGYMSDPRIKKLLDTREVWIIPMLNPDGAEYDVADGAYHYWRKNRRVNSDGTLGVDLNRNYAKNFGGSGSSSFPSSDIYHGPSAFSEPETAAVRDFVRARKFATVLLSFHTYSELILWPWSHTDDPIPNERDRAVFETMGKKMATWNAYKPQKSSDLYLASGDTTDWAYDELKIFAFTFELSPGDMFGGGFYPGAAAIEPTFKANIEPALYLIEKAENPYSVLGNFPDPLGIIP